MNSLFLIFVAFGFIDSTIAQGLGTVQDTNDYISSGYYETVYKADSLYIEQDAASAYELLHELFKRKAPVRHSLYYEYKTYVKTAFLTGHSEIASKGLLVLVDTHGITWKQIWGDVVLAKIANEQDLDSTTFQTLHNKYENALNHELRQHILDMKTADQLYRGDRDYFLQNHKKQDSIDDVNALKLKHIFETYGYPGNELIGRNTMESNVNINAMLLHLKDSIRNSYFIPKLLEFVKKGTCQPKMYGAVVDRFTVMKSGATSVYGVIHKGSNLPPLSKLNRNRKSIGLPSYGYEKWRFNSLDGNRD